MSKRKTLARVFAQAALAQLDIIETRLPGAIAGADAEELHQFRVAVRKTRAYLRLLRKYFPDAAPFADEFGRLARATNAMRDIDVLLAQLHDAEAARPGAGMIAALEADRRRQLIRLRRALRSKHCSRLLQTWRNYLVQLPTRNDLPTTARVSARLVLRWLWLRQCRALLRRGDIDALTAPAPELHQLRIRCKRLRYFGEAFAPQLRARGLHDVQQALKTLQELLGMHCDAVVAEAQWRRLAEQWDAGPARSSARKAPSARAGVGSDEMGSESIVAAWIARAEQQQKSARGGYAHALHEFASACTRLH